MNFYKVEKGSQSLANKIVNLHSNRSFAGVVAGNNVGDIWVNDLTSPTFAIVWSEYLGGFQFMGKSFENINTVGLCDFVDSSILYFLKSKGLDFFEFSCDSEDWLPFVLNSLSNRLVKSEEQYVYYLCKGFNYDSNIMLPEGYRNIEVDTDFINNGSHNIRNIEVLLNEIDKSWGSTSMFLQFAKGFISVYNDEICSFALTHFRYIDTYSIGVETFTPHKQKGLSSSLVDLLIKHILGQNGSVWWDCMESNIASQKTAQKVGLTLDHKYQICWFNF